MLRSIAKCLRTGPARGGKRCRKRRVAKNPKDGLGDRAGGDRSQEPGAGGAQKC